MLVKEKVEKLQQLMRQKGIDTYVIPSADAHQSEYVAPHWKSRAWISGFTGSAGTVVITLDKGNCLWTDGRYFIQAEKQLEGSGIDLYRMGQPSVPTISEWLKENIENGSTIGFDGKVISKSFFDNLEKNLSCKDIKFNLEYDLIDEIWEDRPEIPMDEIFTFDVKYAGKSRIEKLAEVRENMKKTGSTHFVLSSLDDIAWLFNIRGNDVPSNPVIIAYALISMDKATVFVDSKKVPQEVKEELNKDGVELREYDEIGKCLSELETSAIVTYDEAKTNMWIVNSLNSNIKVNAQSNYTTLLKAVKNEVEIANMRNCQLKDGVAMVKFLYWIDNNVGKQEITEISAADELEGFRAEGEDFRGISFSTIAAYKEHAAMMHYSANEETDYELKKQDMFLVDSGGQYLDGTTDITRTIVLGELSDEQKRDFTLVLKGVINLSMAKFLHGCTGVNLDILARRPLWEYGIDYKCGTGHGVGFYLNIHEGPHSIRVNYVPTVLEEGMVVTNEPGVYKEGKHGIRTENMLVVRKDENTEYGGQFMKFETITFCPIDLRGVVVEMLTAEERAWLNDYHKQVYDKLSPYLDESHKSWLKYATRAI
ncbi:Xaa-Pro aminopeptidase [Hathewaya proteolytica DSM 3090]|uniref:Xaa-Pro aminopeptidase n=1 Tax=Hathewaya proteolytica DSM 3090 TaxID=1121331 RepID=A0A1M6P409_9CLOT|nr:aminopeptidase P family protein [Hathewaya proteolytica]SHK02715.1 Xaa-Pro aminopeptidase [Hathewaya proteolytica DSM 3090]